MGQINTGLYSLLAATRVFERLQRIVVRGDTRRIFADDYIKAKPGDRLLDIGCGPGSMLPYLEGVAYTGLDPEPDYIRYARLRYATLGNFIEAGVGDVVAKLESSFEIAIAVGVLHHVDDREAHLLFSLARDALVPGGRLVTSDPVFRTGQNPLARLVIRCDRGRNVRWPRDYQALAEQYFGQVRIELRSDFMRIPYDHCIMSCTNAD